MTLRFASGVMVFAVLESLSLVPAASQDQDIALSELAVNALVNAYKAVGLGSDRDALLRLKPYLVTIFQYGDDFDVSFGREGTHEYHSANVGGRTGAIVRENPNAQFQAMTALPGIIAGEIIAVYRYALSDTRVANGRPLMFSGAYNLHMMPGSWRSLIGFFGLPMPPDAVLIAAAPTPTPRPGWKCLAGDCFGSIANYAISVVNGQINIAYNAII